MVQINKLILQQALDLSPVATIIVGTKGPSQVVVYANHAFEAMSGYDAGELIGQAWDELASAAGKRSAETEHNVSINCHPRLGADDQLSLDMLPLYDRPGLPRYWVGTEQGVKEADVQANDSERDALISVLRDARMHLRRLDGRDSATGVLNRRAFDEMLQRDWAMARREQSALGFVLFQVDALDIYRDVFGRHAADSCLRKIAHAITGSMRRAGDLTARFADDRFAVLIGECDAENAVKLASGIAEKVRGLSIHHPRSPVDRFVTLSFGIATVVPAGNSNASTLVDLAEQSLAEQPSQRQGLSAV